MMYNLIDLYKWKDKEGKKVYKFDCESSKWIYIKLKKGVIAGEHYHKGENPLKNPEVNIILKGKMKYVLENVETGEKEEIIVEGPVMLEIFPFVNHVIEALEDSFFLEPFSEETLKDRYEMGD